MNTNYLLSVLDLYLHKETNGKLIIEVDNDENIVKINFSYSFDHTNRTFVKVTKSEFLDIFEKIIDRVKGNSVVIQDDISVNNNKKIYSYSFSEGRKISFIGFSDSEMNKIKSKLNIEDDLVIDFDEDDNLVIDIDDEPMSYNDIYEKNKKNNEKMAFSFGFTNYLTLFLTTVWILDVFMIALWIFKAMMK